MSLGIYKQSLLLFTNASEEVITKSEAMDVLHNKTYSVRQNKRNNSKPLYSGHLQTTDTGRSSLGSSRGSTGVLTYFAGAGAGVCSPPAKTPEALICAANYMYNCTSVKEFMIDNYGILFNTYLLGARETVCFLIPRRRCFPRRSRGKHRRSRGHKTYCFPEGPVIYSYIKCQS